MLFPHVQVHFKQKMALIKSFKMIDIRMFFNVIFFIFRITILWILFLELYCSKISFPQIFLLIGYKNDLKSVPIIFFEMDYIFLIFMPNLTSLV